MKIEFKQPSVEEVKTFYGGISYPGTISIQGLYVDGILVAVSGILMEPTYSGSLIEDGGKVIGFIDTSKLHPIVGMMGVLAVRDFLKDQDGPIYAPCDASTHPQAPKLLATLGFVETDELVTDTRRENSKQMRVWKWQRC